MNSSRESLEKITKKSSKKLKLFLIVAINLIFITAFVMLTVAYGPLLYNEIRYNLNSFFGENKKYGPSSDLPRRVSSGEEILDKPIVQIPEPKSRDFSVVIPKLEINQKVVPNVDLSNETEVQNALSQGIGWAKGTVEPGAIGNSLLFSHSTINSWDIWRYNAEFSLLDKLEIGETFTVVYQDRQYDFLIFEKQIVEANDTSYLTSAAEGRVVTLQTCYPPGISTQRLLVRGRLIAMETK